LKYLTRIVTFRAYPKIAGDNPRTILAEGSRVLTLSDMGRYFAVRKVCYNDDTPIYTSQLSFYETRYGSVKELIDCHPGLKDSPILDADNCLLIYKGDEQISTV
jgi:hypothetical protein